MGPFRRSRNSWLDNHVYLTITLQLIVKALASIVVLGRLPGAGRHFNQPRATIPPVNIIAGVLLTQGPSLK